MPRRPSQVARTAARAVLGAGVVAGLGIAGWGLLPTPAAPEPSHTFDHRSTAQAAVPSPDRPVLKPSRLRIADAGIDAPLSPERVTHSGELVIPGDPGVVGYWHGGTPEGRAEMPVRGTLVLAGHVDVDGRLGSLHSLSEVKAGTAVVLTGADGRTERWRVDALEVRAKDDLPRFRAGGPRRLAIVTCGGPVLSTPAGHTYRDNVIAWASPSR